MKLKGMKTLDSLVVLLNHALNEARFLDLRLEGPNALIEVRGLTYPPDGEPEAALFTLCLVNFGRMAASLRRGDWNDDLAPIIPLNVDSLSSDLQPHLGRDLYGWDFVNSKEETRKNWISRLSLNMERTTGSQLNSLDLFQDGSCHLDLCIWFEQLKVLRADGREVNPEHFGRDGKAWWDAFNGGDPRTSQMGMVPLKGDNQD